MKQDHAKCIPWCIYIMKPKRGLGNGTCIYTVSVTQSDQKIAGFIIKSPLPGGFLLPLQTTKENFFFLLPVVLVLEDVILETQDPETQGPET